MYISKILKQPNSQYSSRISHSLTLHRPTSFPKCETQCFCLTLPVFTLIFLSAKTLILNYFIWINQCVYCFHRFLTFKGPESQIKRKNCLVYEPLLEILAKSPQAFELTNLTNMSTKKNVCYWSFVVGHILIIIAFGDGITVPIADGNK